MKQFTLNQTYAKVLYTINELNKESYYPLNEGVYKIVAGILDDDVSMFSNLSTFGTLTSYSSKKICHINMALFKQGMLERIFDVQSKKLYWRVSEKGKEALIDYFSKHKIAFRKRVIKNNPTIVKIAGQ